MLARSVALVAMLATVAGSAHAERVGFVNGSSQPGAVATIKTLRTRIASSGHRALTTGAVRGALEDPLEPAKVPTLDPARDALVAAKKAYAAFEYAAALDRLAEVDAVIDAMPPSDQAVELLADRHFLAGQVFAGQGDAAKAKAAFQLVHRLSPARSSLDPTVYHPDLVALYRAALRPSAAAVSLRITTEPAGAEVWIDHRNLGPSPVSARDVSTGPHRIAVSARHRTPAVQIVDVTTGSPTVSLTLARIAVEEEIRALRRQMLAAPRDATWRQRAAAAAALAGVGAVVVVRDAIGDGFEAATYRVSDRSMSEWLPVPSTRFDLAWTAGDGERPPLAGGIAANASTGDSRAWYSTWWGRGAIAGGAAIVVGVVVYAVAFSGGEPSVEVGGWCFDPGCP